MNIMETEIPWLDGDGASEAELASSPVARGPQSRQSAVERLLAEGEEQLALVSSISTLGFWNWDRSTDEVWASKHARSILGFDASAPLTRRLAACGDSPVGSCRHGKGDRVDRSPPCGRNGASRSPART